MQDAEDVRQVLSAFQRGYTLRQVAELDGFMTLFAERDDIELIGIGASERNGYEWFQGREAIREIIEGDWVYWGDVVIDVAGARITTVGGTAWLSTTGKVVQTTTHLKALPGYLRQMSELIDADGGDPAASLMEATHFGMRRLRELAKGEGYGWPFVLTAVLLRDGGSWRFHTLHWSMPVD